MEWIGISEYCAVQAHQPHVEHGPGPHGGDAYLRRAGQNGRHRFDARDLVHLRVVVLHGLVHNLESSREFFGVAPPEQSEPHPVKTKASESLSV